MSGDRMLAITLHQPWAALVAHGHKTIETRPWPPNGPMRPDGVRGYPGLAIGRGERIAIHAAARPFGIDSPQADVVRSLPLASYRRLREQLGRGDIEHSGMGGYPLGAVVATVRVVDAWPIVGNPIDNPTTGPCIWREDVTMLTRVCGDDEPGDMDDQLPLGDWTPGRWGWLLADVHRLATPVPCRGRQGVWALPDDIAEEVRRAGR